MRWDRGRLSSSSGMQALMSILFRKASYVSKGSWCSSQICSQLWSIDVILGVGSKNRTSASFNVLLDPDSRESASVQPTVSPARWGLETRVLLRVLCRLTAKMTAWAPHSRKHQQSSLESAKCKQLLSDRSSAGVNISVLFFGTCCAFLGCVDCSFYNLQAMIVVTLFGQR